MIRFAYIDPGTGSIVLQAVVGTVAGAVYAVRKHLRHFFNRLRKEQ